MMKKSVYCIKKVKNKEIKINDQADEVVAELFESFFNRYQSNL